MLRLKKTAKLLCLIAFIAVSSNAEEMSSKEIIKILENANKATQNKEEKIAEKSPQQIMQELREKKEILTLESEQGTYNNTNLNSRIRELVVFFKEKAKLETASISLKDFALMEECDKKCIKYAIINKSELDDSILKLQSQENLYKKYTNYLNAANALYKVSPASVKKQRLERLEDQMYQTTSESNAVSSFSTTTETNPIVLEDNEIINGQYIVQIKSTSVVIKRKSI